MLKEKLLEDLKKAAQDLGFPITDIVCTVPQNPAFGDYTTNLALQLAKQKSASSYQSSDEIANKIVDRLQATGGSKEYLEKIEIAGGGFINFFIKDEVLLKNIKDAAKILQAKSPQKIMVEYGHVNLLKEIHIGHLRTFILGESLCRIFEVLGHKVFRANYQGDIGLHIAKAIWGIKKLGLPVEQLSLEEKADFLGRAYAQGNKSYEEDPTFKEEIDKINTGLYKKDPKTKEIYTIARAWSLAYFEPVYKLLGIKYDRCFFESEVYEEGGRIVSENIGKIFEKNDGAVIFPGEKYGLHTRVFINSAGNPTYEGKDMGLARLEYKTFKFDNSIHVVDSEQEGYFQVIIKAIELLFPYLKGKKYHLSYGLVDLKEGKMSSRTGNVVTIDDLYHLISEKIREVLKEERAEIASELVSKVVLGAIKFSYLKFAPASNFIFDLNQSVSLQGDSGPYVQYTYARSQSVLKQAKLKTDKTALKNKSLEKEERALIRRLEYFSDVVGQSAKEYRPNLLSEYLLDLSKEFNLFYQKHRIIQSEARTRRLELTKAVGEVLEKGLYLLGIDSPERM